MPLWVKLAAAFVLAAPLVASPQTQSLQGRARGEPVGMAVPGTSVAGAEEPTALEVNPAGVGFVGDLTLQYFHEGRSGTGQAGDGFWLAAPIGALVPAISMQWLRPASGGGSRFRKTTLGLALSGRPVSLALAWNFYNSPDRELDELGSFDAGLTLRPWRHLSFGASALGMTARLGERRLPIRYDFGVATRLWRDTLTLSADLLTDDRARNDLTLNAAAFGVGVELGIGVALQFQLQISLHGRQSGPAGANYAQLALTFNGAHGGITAAGGGGDNAERTWLAGARLSAQRYRSPTFPGSTVPQLDLSESLSRTRSLFFGGDRDRHGELLRRLAEVRDDASLPALAVRIDSLPIGQGRIEELRSLLLEVKARKPVVAYLVGGGMKEYYLASAASLVLAPPSAELFPNGLSSSTPFIRDGLAKIGVTFDVVVVGRYKNAPEALVRQDMSDAQRAATDRILDDLFARQVRDIAAARGLDEGRVRELVDAGVFSAEQARAAKLIDAVAWPDEVEQALSDRLGHRARLASHWERAEERAAQRWGPRPSIAVVRVEGALAMGKSRSGPFGLGGIAGSETIAELVKRAAADGSVVAIVLRVDSPGGDVLASDLIWREVMQARRAGKPVIASMGDLAASGGYLVSVAADAIVAEPSTLTGSIGVFALKPDLSGLLGKIGVAAVTLKRGQHADLQSLTRRWTAEERKLVEKQVLAFYELFLSRVREGRRLPTETLDGIAGGQVWTGAQALERGLVDQLGSLENAILLAREKAGFSPGADLEVRPFEPDRGFLDALAGSLAPSKHSPLSALAAQLPELRAAALLLEMGPLVALPPGWIGTPGAPPASGSAP
jgi:protease-4